MATQETPSFDDLEPSESVVGEIRELTPNCGKYDTTVIELARGIGDVIGIKHTEQTSTFTNEGGEEQEYDIWRVRELSAGGSE
jgi:hypothetical protein